MSVDRAAPIVVGIDDSPRSFAALDWAAAEAVHRRLPLRLVHVVEWQPHGQQPHGHQHGQQPHGHWPSIHHVPRPERSSDELADAALARVSEIAPDATVESIDGDAAHVLIRESTRASLVVVGNRGLGGFRGLLAGPVSVQTAAHAHCPVVVVRPFVFEPPSPDWSPAGAPAPERHGVDRVVVGTDCSGLSDHALAFAFEEAALRGTGLTVVHAWRYPVSTGPGEMIFTVLDRTDLADLEGDLVAKSIASHRETYPEVSVRQVLAQGNAAGVLVHESFGADLLVVGSRGHGGFMGLLLGSVSDAAIRHAGCPVAVVR